MSDGQLPDYVLRNRTAWDRWAPDWVEPGERNWSDAEPSWGIWGIPESERRHAGRRGRPRRHRARLRHGLRLGLAARLGARPVGIDNSPKQLETARRLQREHGLEFPLLLGNAESVPYPDASFDLAISEYGAAIWCDPFQWIPEAARLLRPGGRLSFLGNSFLYMLCTPDEDDLPPTDRLLRDQFGAFRFEWPGDESVEFHLPHGEMIRLLRASGFEIEDLIEIRAPEGATTRQKYMIGRVVAPLAERGDLEGPQATLAQTKRPGCSASVRAPARPAQRGPSGWSASPIPASAWEYRGAGPVGPGSLGAVTDRATSGAVASPRLRPRLRPARPAGRPPRRQRQAGARASFSMSASSVAACRRSHRRRLRPPGRRASATP